MKVLVTGGAGYIGSHTCLELLQAGHEVVVVDNLRNADRQALTRVMELAGRELAFYQFDLRDEEQLARVFYAHRMDSVIHFAGLKAVGESVSIPLEYYANNLGCTLALCRQMAAHGVHDVIFSSSATVYEQGNRMPLREEARLGCTNPYGWTKFMGEQILRDAAAADSRLSVVLLRYFNPIGAHPSGRIGEDPAGIPNNLLPYITQTALGRLERLTVHGDDYDTPDGTGVRDYIHVVDLAQGHLKALDYAAAHRGAVAINLGTGQGYSVLDILHAFEKVNRVKVPYVVGPRRPGDIATVYADPGLARELLGWQARLGIEDMCRDAWRWQKNNPQGYRGA
ncbi:MAG: UDP-glucose 4-epimerase GalE [Clostridiales bacterium]|nr:UDP-glucose 4-epimerase GalE [Clostridiales bacterium]